ncbi:MAG: OmpA family protein [Bacteroidia bacterium]|nr:OmpA family protein [Bacteroidia bacterium]
MTNRLFVFSLILLFIFPVFSLAQKPEDFGIKSKKALRLYLDGLTYAQQRMRVEADTAFKQAVEIEPDFAHAHFQLGTNAYARREFEEALPHLEKAFEIAPAAFQNIEFYLGEVYFYAEDYEPAARFYEIFLRSQKGRTQDIRKATLYLRNARFAAEAIKKPVPFNPVNMGENINSAYDDYIPYLTADDSYLLFVSRRPESVGGFNATYGGYSEDFFFCEYKEGHWTAAANLGPPINTALNEGASALTQDGKVIYYTACNQPDGFGDCDLYYAFRQADGSWSNGINLGPNVNTRNKETQPTLSHDGKTLYFSSGRPEGLGMGDIWYSRLEDGKWTEAKNMGEPINTPGHEDGPFIHADGVTLYFSSNFHPGFGQSDLYVSYKNEDETWTAPQNLGYPVNTAGNETNLFVNTRGNRALFTADRDGGMGKTDIYEFVMPENIRPRIATFLRGIVKDSITDVPVYAKIDLIDVEQGDTIREIFSSKTDGKFLMSLPLEKEYAAFVQAAGYLFKSQNFYLKNLPEDTYFDLIIDMVPLKKDKKVVLQNIFFETGKYELKETSDPELQFLTYFLSTNPGMRIEIQGHTDDVGSDEANMTLSRNRANVVRDYLIRNGIAASRIEANGYGETQPKVPNSSEENRKLNRRTEFRIIQVN